MRKEIKNWVFMGITGFIVFTLAGIYLTYPLIFHLGEYTTGLSDELLIAWIHSWVTHIIFSGNILSLFDANIYYPYQNSLAYSDLFLTTALLTYIPTILVGEPIAANNVVIISSLIFIGFSVYVLCYYMTKDVFASVFAGLLTIFSPAVLDKKVHIQILAIGFVPLAILFFIIFLKKKQTRYLFLSLLFFLLQTYNSFMPGYFIVFSYCIILIFSYFNKKKNLKEIMTKNNLILLLISFLLIILITIPYFQVSKEFSYTRDIRESIHLALHPEDFLFTSNDSRIMRHLNTLPFNQTSQNDEFKPGFLGAVFTSTVLLALFYVIKTYGKRDMYTKSFLFISLLGLILSLGPALHLARKTIHEPFPIPLPYALFYYVLPGFQGFRNSARWEMLFILAAAVLIAIVLHIMLRKYSLKIRIGVYAILIFGVIAEFNFPMQYGAKVPQKENFPAVYSWLKTTPTDSIIIEMPIYTWNMHPYVFDENMREYYSTVHFRKMVNGASGFSPPPWQSMVREILYEFPSTSMVYKLKKMGVNYIIIHKSEYDILNKDKYTLNGKQTPNGKVILEGLAKNKSVRFIKRFKDDYVFQIY